MTIESQSEFIVEIASVVLAVACLVMAFGALATWRSRARNRIKRRGAPEPLEILFLGEPQKTVASPLKAPGQQPQT